MPGDTGKYQIDYILMNSRYWNSVTNAITYPGADIDSYHNPVVASLRVKLKKVLKARLNKQRNQGRSQDFNLGEHRSSAPLHWEWGLGRGLCHSPLPRIFFGIFISKW